MGNNIEAKKKRVPIEEGLFTLPSSPSEEPHPLGSRCKQCGELFFPQVAACAKCLGQDMQEVVLSRRGQVFSSTVIFLAPPLYEGPVPYSFGVVKLPEGVLVPTLLSEFRGEEPLEIGTDVEMIIEKFGETENGEEIVTYKFRPV